MGAEIPTTEKKMGSRVARVANLLLLPRWSPNHPSDAKRLVFIRHAEGWHNKDYNEVEGYMERGLGETEKYWDARLTPFGQQQSRDIAPKLQEEVPGVQLVVVSPLSRAIETAALAFPEDVQKKPFVSTSLCRERIWTHQCDRRRDRGALERDFPFVDFSQIQEGPDEMWDSKEIEPHVFEVEPHMNSTLCARRATQFLQWLWKRPEDEIAIVSHWVFLKHVFKLYPEQTELQEDFGNAEYRLVTLARDKDNAPAKDEM